ncbi:MAG: methyltransferase [Mariprofundus sp.]|nr:methyltransferase [Mariprofundus sp.]
MIEGIAEKILPGGESTVRVAGSLMLVANAVPGDQLSVRPTVTRRGVMRAVIDEVLVAAPARITPACPVAAECGGCALQFLDATAHAELKSAWVRDAFSKLLEKDTQWIEAETVNIASRRRVRWVIGQDEQGRFAGFYQHASHQVVRHDKCMVLTSALTALHGILTPYLYEDVEAVQALALMDGVHVIVETKSADITQLENLPALLDGGQLLQWWWRHEGITRPLKKPIKQFHDSLPVGDRTIQLSVGPDDFVQGQQAGNCQLIRQIQQWSGSPRRIADLFCGIGNLSLPLAVATGASLFGAELNPASVRAASKNAKQLGVDAHFVQANLFEDFDMVPYIGVDLLILDPPRRGAKRICSAIHKLMPEKIMMLSCDPAAGARDGALLRQHGYHLKGLQALDLFAYAGHVEALSLWERGA